jgi:hypothetical protein
MILYVNGDSHAAAAEAVNPHAWACDDGELWQCGREPHPANDAVSFGAVLANQLGWQYHNHSQAGCSNARIMRTTRQWINENPNLVTQCFMVIQWTTWEREEWWHQGQDFQVNASGVDTVPDELRDRYRKFVVNVDWDQCRAQAHEDIWEFHQELDRLGIPHVMFNGNNHFAGMSTECAWGPAYMAPYDAGQTYDSVLKSNGFHTVNAQSWHFGANAHCFWAEYLLHYMHSHNLIAQSEISTN